MLNYSVRSLIFLKYIVAFLPYLKLNKLQEEKLKEEVKEKLTDCDSKNYAIGDLGKDF